MKDLRDHTDLELVARLKGGDERAFSEIYFRFWPPLYLHAQRMLNDEEDARDAVQEVLLLFWVKAEALPDIRNVRAYLYRMVRNRVLDWLSEQKNRDDSFTSLSDFLETESPSADSAVHEAELIQLIEEEVANMPSKMREVYELSRVEHLSHKEIAERLSVTHFTVKTQLNNAIRRIKKRIGHLLSLSFFF